MLFKFLNSKHETHILFSQYGSFNDAQFFKFLLFSKYNYTYCSFYIEKKWVFFCETSVKHKILKL